MHTNGSTYPDRRPVLQLGNVVATPGALALLGNAGIAPTQLLNRHLFGDWGVVDAEDWKLNDASVRPESQARVLSVYTVGDQQIWVITEADRSVTTILLPEEY